MSIDPVSALAPLQGGMSEITRAQGSQTSQASQVDFGRWMLQQLSDTNRQIDVAEHSLVRLAAGEGNLHQVMLDLEKARLAFQLTLQVRNKLLEGYQEIMRMQV